MKQVEFKLHLTKEESEELQEILNHSIFWEHAAIQHVLSNLEISYYKKYGKYQRTNRYVIGVKADEASRN